MVFDLTKEVTTLGRDVGCDIVLGDPEVSRQHARLTRTPGGYVLEDLGSTNGTFVNNERLTSPQVLHSGDLIGLSEKVTLTFDMVSPEGAKTVMGEPSAEEGPTPTVPEPPPQRQPPPPQQAPVGPMAPVEEEPKRGISPWIFAGCGCLLILVLLIAFLVFMDARYPDLLYGPIMPILDLFGF
jgi:predicted component of type VI protein secretion system